MSGTSDNTSQKALKVAAIGSSILTILKFVAFWLTGSVLALSAMYDSLADTFSSCLNYYVYEKSREDADREHPFGHGGYEVVATLAQGVLIFVLGLSLLREAFEKLQNPFIETGEFNALPIAGVILLGSAFGGFAIQMLLQRSIQAVENKNERSLTLETDLAHYAGDVAVNLFSALGLALVYWSTNPIWDGVFGLAGAGFLIYTAIPILKQAFRDIVHVEAPTALQQSVVDIAMNIDPRIHGLHQLRSRELGPVLFVDFHLSVESSITVLDAHHIADKVEAAILKAIPRANVLIHIDPHLHPEEDSWEPSYSIPKQIT